ncbi:hypothetical protein KJ693_04920 [bacterium]|nr:hypothetical protein [bacterium]MBU1614639.1 hypothetical protein [bacterium]
MDAIFEFFRPEVSIISEAIRFAVFLFGSFVAIWAVELWLCRSFRPSKKDAELNVYFSWLTLFTFYAGLETIFTISLLIHYKNNGVSLLHGLPYLALGLLSLGIAWHFNRMIAQRIEED